MIILDTNVVSEPMKAEANDAVRAWLDAQDVGRLYLTSVTLAELRLGAQLLPLGRRRAALQAKIDAVVGLFAQTRILPFDVAAAEAYAVLSARASAAGRAIGVADGQIAAIAAVKGFSVATRDAAPFLAAGVTVINPWEVEAKRF